MLIRYKKDFEKIAMGLLSFVPELKDVKKLQKTIKEYELNPNYHLFLWRDDDVLGAIGVQTDDEYAIIEHISVNPSYRNLGIGKKMIDATIKLYKEDLAIVPSDITEEFYKKCFEKKDIN